MKLSIALVAVFLASLMLGSVHSWGRIGHSTMGQIVDEIMDSTSRKTVLSLFNDDQAGESLAAASIWADQVDHNGQYPWSASLHYANVPDWECRFEYDRDCHSDRCIVGAIVNYSTRARDMRLSEDQRIEAAKWLIHYVEDIHQPMHVSFATDRGGNSLKGTFLGQSVNLHSLWDETMIRHRISQDFSSGGSSDLNMPYEEYLEKYFKNSKYQNWGTCVFDSNLKNCISGWADETSQLACEYGYSDTAGRHITNSFSLGEEYYKRGIKVVELQMVKGSYRLAVLLDSLFPSGQPAVRRLVNSEVA